MADDISRAGKTYVTEAIVDFVDRTHVVHDASLARAGCAVARNDASGDCFHFFGFGGSEEFQLLRIGSLGYFVCMLGRGKNGRPVGDSPCSACRRQGARQKLPSIEFRNQCGCPI